MKWMILIILIICVIWTVLGLDYVGPFKKLAVIRLLIKDKPEENAGCILFYGASNFARWHDMPESFPKFKVVNHGFGGSRDEDLIKYADRLLFPYKPQVVLFQTGSNDYVNQNLSQDELMEKVMERKICMFELFHKHLPETRFIIMSGLLLPGRKQFRELTQEINRRLEDYCSKSDYCYFVDASNMTYDAESDVYHEELFVKDLIHLNHAGQQKWAREYISPALNEIVRES